MPAPDDERVRTEAEGHALMAEGSARLIDGVERLGSRWVVSAVTGLVDVWGRLDAPARAATVAAATEAGDRAATRVGSELRALFALDAAAQRATPLEIIRSLRSEAGEVLRGAGVPEVVRDPFETRAFPDDVYGIVLKTPAELGDDDLGGALLAWGMGKAKVLRSRAGAGPDPG
ncbi:MAG TPA: hypothetical protein VGP92_10235 [Acidimicrobiia bacterium]|nr:hypothetical protein [Acidimicrobiia bacterium]